MAVSLTVYEIFSVSEGRDLETGGKGDSRSIERRRNDEHVSMAPGGRKQVRPQCPLEGALRQVRSFHS